jgi:probable phosphoglycerate mutase
MTRRFVLVRHGNTFAPGEAPRRIGAGTDLPLVETGREQAQRLGNWFARQKWRFDRILCSPLARTRETLEIIRAALDDAPVAETATLLAEIDHGIDENQPDGAVIDRIGETALDAWERLGIAPLGWNVDRDARIEGWRDLFRYEASGTTLLVTSNGAARFALLADAGLAAQAGGLPDLRLRTGAFGVIQATQDGLWITEWDRRP